MYDFLKKVFYAFYIAILVVVVISSCIYNPIVGIVVLSILVTLFILFRFTTLPYKLIAYVFKKTSSAESCSIILPFKVNKVPDEEAFITVPNIPITDWRKAHELHHVRQVRAYINKYGEIGRYIFCYNVIKYLIIYGYDNSPIEIEANKAADEQCR